MGAYGDSSTFGDRAEGVAAIGSQVLVISMASRVNRGWAWRSSQAQVLEDLGNEVVLYDLTDVSQSLKKPNPLEHLVESRLYPNLHNVTRVWRDLLVREVVLQPEDRHDRSGQVSRLRRRPHPLADHERQRGQRPNPVGIGVSVEVRRGLAEVGGHSGGENADTGVTDPNGRATPFLAAR